MFDRKKFSELLNAYKESFLQRWTNEKFKWVAIKQFQGHWNIDAPNFPEMLTAATNQTGSLLTSYRNYPLRMIFDFIKKEPETVREMFRELFDEANDLNNRIENFLKISEEFRKKYLIEEPTWKKNYQNTTSATAFLWLRFPDKYYLYKITECQKAAEALSGDFRPKRIHTTDNVLPAFHFYDEIRTELLKDKEIRELLFSKLADDCYEDTSLHTLTIDFVHFVKEYVAEQLRNKRTDTEWSSSVEEYYPSLTKDNWIALLSDSEVFTPPSLQIMKRMLDSDGQATCKQLAEKYGEDANFYNRGSSSLAERIAKKTNCPILKGTNKKSKWWPILYLGKDIKNRKEGTFIWKLRPELAEALREVDLSQVQLYAEGVSPKRHFWWLNANPKIWSFSQISIGEEIGYTLKNDNGNKRRVFQNFLDAKAGDIVIGYESQPRKQIVAMAEISRANDGEKLYFRKIETLPNPIDYADFKDAKELSNMEFLINPNGSLFKVSEDEFNFLLDMIRDENPKPVSIKTVPYNKDSFLEEVFIPKNKDKKQNDEYDELVALLKRKKNLILQGAPGVGKTFIARRLAYAMMGEKDDSRIAFIQFHQNYSYEDFIMGYKPDGQGFKLQDGIFYKFCKTASNYPYRDYFFIIDEINRGNLSKIFGELLVLLESDYRGSKGKAILAYNQEPFSIPNNLYIIGMMNTADRSLAMIDYALRRRFSFYDVKPGFDSEKFSEYKEALSNEKFNKVISIVTELNKKIADEFGEGYCIGHSYFCGQTECSDKWLKQIIKYEIVPMLQEYWFDDKTKWEHWAKQLSDAIE